MRKLGLLALCLSFGLFSVPVQPVHAAPSPEDVAFFENKIRPVLALECYECHNSHGKAKGGLVLDFAGGLIAGGDSGPTIEPGKPKASLLLKVLRHEIDDLRMPKSGAKVSKATAADFSEWIRRGAPDPRTDPPSKEDLKAATSWETVFKARQNWWSFKAIAPATRPAPDALIDTHLRERLKSEGLPASPATDPRTQLRRLSFVLTGLPPTREEIAAFLKHHQDDPGESLEREVDRLLDSPAFGERWARHWMDWWRYADSHGSEGDPAIPHAYQYRDYLIRALNADVPYNQLLREHVAGDLLTEPRLNPELGLNESIIGPAHFRMVFHGFAPTDALDELVRFTDNQIDVLTKASMGLTVSCARCHNHKFDAISQADFTALFGVLSTTRPGMLPADSPERRDLNKYDIMQLKHVLRGHVADAWLKKIDAIDADNWKDVKADKPDHPLFAWRNPTDAQKLHQQAVEARRKTTPVAKRWSGIELQDGRFSGTAMTPNADATPHAAHQFPLGIAGDFIVPREGDKIFDRLLPTGLYTHLISDKHSGTFTTPTFHISSNVTTIAARVFGRDDARLRYAVQNYPRNGTVYPIKTLSSSDLKWERFDIKYWRGDDAHLELTTAADGPVVRSDKARSHFGVTDVVLLEEGQSLPKDMPGELFDPVFNQEMDKFVPHRHYKQALRSALEAWATPPPQREEDLPRFERQMALLSAFVRQDLLPNKMVDIPGSRELVQELRKLEADIKVPTRVPGLIEAEGRDAPLFVRGNHKLPGDPVPRRFLETVDDEPFRASNSARVELADDILREDNPFTSRVIVNRLWHHVFGTGLFATPDNLGRLGEPPSHPELLDQLARRFMEEEWSIKTALRHMVLSETFLQASTPATAARERDPSNRLLSHFPLRRLEAEAIRDSMIRLAGSADPKMYGPGADGNSGRRSVYVRTIRNRRDAFLQTFDAPEPLTTRGRRDATNVPGQSLTLLNDPRVIQLASGFGNQKAGAADSERITHLYESALGRLPTDDERVRALAFVRGLDADQKEALKRSQDIESKLATERSTVAGLLEPARKAILAKRGTQPKPAGPTPVAHWDFLKDGKDRIGSLHIALKNGAKFDGGLKVGDRAYAESPALPFDLNEKTLHVRVKLDTLNQRAGGAMNVQTGDGNVFDAIVYAEAEELHWMAGSDRFQRTESFRPPAETEADKQAVTMTLTYKADGTITGYRNGQPYGRSIRKQQAAIAYRKEDAKVVFGCRHTPAAPGRVLRGTILEAKLFDRALSPEEVIAASGTTVSEKDLLASLSEAQRNQLDTARAAIATLDQERAAFAETTGTSPKQAWPDLAQAIFNLKEFIYLR